MSYPKKPYILEDTIFKVAGKNFNVLFNILAFGELILEIAEIAGLIFIMYLAIFEIQSFWMTAIIIFSFLSNYSFMVIFRAIIIWTGIYSIFWDVPHWVLNLFS